MQKFLELLYAESSIDDDTIDGILELADMYDAKTAIKRCEEFLIRLSGLSMKQKFHFSVMYKMSELMKKCVSEMKTVGDLQSIIPQEDVKFDHDVWKELFLKSLSMIPK